MTIPTSFSRHRLALLFLIASLTLGFGLKSAQAVLSEGRAHDAALTIERAADPLNKAFDVAQFLTLGTDPADAAANADKIVKALRNDSLRRLYAGRIALGIASNFPARIADIIGKVVASNTALRKNSALLVQQVAASSSVDQIEQIAVALGSAMRRTEGVSKQAMQFTTNLMAAINNKPGLTPQARANALATVAADLAVGVIGRSKTLSSSQTKQIKAIASALGSSVKPLADSNPGTAALVYQSIGIFAQDLKNAVKGSVTSKALNSLMGNSQNTIQQQLPEAIPSVQQAFQNVQNNVQIPTGNVVPPETPV